MSLIPAVVRAAAALTAAFVPTAEVRVARHTFVDWSVNVEDATNVTQIEIDFQWSITPDDDPGAVPANFSNLKDETIAAGVSTINNYVIQLPVTGVERINVTTPAVGNFMRARVRVSTGTGVDSSVSVVALQRATPVSH